jgi:hypothetical protein
MSVLTPELRRVVTRRVVIPPDPHRWKSPRESRHGIAPPRDDLERFVSGPAAATAGNSSADDRVPGPVGIYPALRASTSFVVALRAASAPG